MSSISAVQNPGAVPYAAAKPSSAGNEGTQTGSPLKAVDGTSVPPVVSYPSSRISIDPLFDKTIIEVLNPSDGVVVQQLPSREVVRRYEASAAQHAADAAAQGKD